MAKQVKALYNEYLTDGWVDKLDDPKVWERVDNIRVKSSGKPTWNARYALQRVVKRRIRARNERNGVPTHITDKICENLCEGALFIGFARRFATYKRATLIFMMRKIEKDLNDKDKPVVIFFAGKAHPADRPGQELIRQIYELSMKDEFLGKIILLENYNMSLARYLVSGVDVC